MGSCLIEVVVKVGHLVLKTLSLSDTEHQSLGLFVGEGQCAIERAHLSKNKKTLLPNIV
jgi:hypothetical protein